MTLLLGMVALCLTAVGSLIAMAQMVIARDRFEIDSFDRQYTRRVAVYEATRQFLEAAMRETLSENDIRAYGLHTLDAQFLFDERTYKYLRELCWRVQTWIDAKSSLDQLSPGEERESKVRISAEQLDWIIKQGDEANGFATWFRPYLELR